eukprot:TRINITY_DN16239_c0_g1_i3.p2 TRINITY_DN16239_c0_g1~~TRINITY_DN16239_c0_g1_i3.p2  ORF type:complete len:107 (-),score=12.96 TRINITY_DN16239_c0_g1_i3:3-323(-)
MACISLFDCYSSLDSVSAVVEGPSLDCSSLGELGWQLELPPSPLPPPLPPPLSLPLLPVLGVARVEALNCMGDEEVSVSATTTCLLYTSDAADEEDSVVFCGRRLR